MKFILKSTDYRLMSMKIKKLKAKYLMQVKALDFTTLRLCASAVKLSTAETLRRGNFLLNPLIAKVQVRAKLHLLKGNVI